MFIQPPNKLVARVYEAFFTPPRIPYSEFALELLERAEHSTLPLGETDLAVSSWGNGPTVLLVHGWGGHRLQLGAFVPALVEAGFRVVTFDFPAHGDTPGKTTNLLEMAPALEVVAEREGPVTAIVAHSFGTLITSYALVHHNLPAPEKLVYFGALNRLMDSIPRFQKLANLTDELTEGLRLTIEDFFGKELLESIANEKLASQLPIPALMFHDRTDAMTPIEDSRNISANWPHAQLIETNGLGHRRALQDPEVIGKVVDFVRKNLI